MHTLHVVLLQIELAEVPPLQQVVINCLCSTQCIADELSGICADSPSLHLRHLSDASFSICLQTSANGFLFFTFDMSVFGSRVDRKYTVADVD